MNLNNFLEKIKKLKIIFFVFIMFFFTGFYSLVFSSDVKCTSTESSDTSCYLKGHDIITNIAKTKCNITDKKIINNICSYMKPISQFESEGVNEKMNYCLVKKGDKKVKRSYPIGGVKPSGCLPGTTNTAKGWFQFTDGSFRWILAEIRKVDPTFPKRDNITDYTYEEQAQFAAMRWTKGNGSKNNAICGVFKKDVSESFKNYCENHNTNCAKDKITKNSEKGKMLLGGLSKWAGCNGVPDIDTSDMGSDDDDDDDGGGGGFHPAEHPGDSGGDITDENWCKDPKFSGACLDNPFSDEKPQTLKELIMMILQIIIYVSIPLIVLGFVYSGFLFLSGQGKEEDLKKAKLVLIYSIIGAVIIVSAQSIYSFIDATSETILKDL